MQPLYITGSSLGDWSRNAIASDQVQAQREAIANQLAIARMQEQGLNNRFGADANIRRDEMGRKYGYMDRALGQDDRHFVTDADLRRTGLANQFAIAKMPYEQITKADEARNALLSEQNAIAAKAAQAQIDGQLIPYTYGMTPFQEAQMRLAERQAGAINPNALATEAPLFGGEAEYQAAQANSDLYQKSGWFTNGALRRSKSGAASMLMADPNWSSRFPGVYYDYGSDTFMPKQSYGLGLALSAQLARRGPAQPAVPGAGLSVPTGISRPPGQAPAPTQPLFSPGQPPGF